MPIRTKIVSPDPTAFREVSKLLSRLGVSVMASSVGALTHTCTSRITDKTQETLEKLGAKVEVG